jgi:hypothetical protein
MNDLFAPLGRTSPVTQEELDDCYGGAGGPIQEPETQPPKFLTLTSKQRKIAEDWNEAYRAAKFLCEHPPTWDREYWANLLWSRARAQEMAIAFSSV